MDRIDNGRMTPDNAPNQETGSPTAIPKSERRHGICRVTTLTTGSTTRCCSRTASPGSIPDCFTRALCQLSSDEINSIQERVTRSFSNEGISFTVYGDAEANERIIPVDCLPRILPA